MSDTPRTDDVWQREYPADQATDVRLERVLSHARELERELNEVLKEGEEQARLLGKGGSREAKLLAGIAVLEDEILCMQYNYDMSRAECDQLRARIAELEKARLG
jgi:hypothetical protein